MDLCTRSTKDKEPTRSTATRPNDGADTTKAPRSTIADKTTRDTAPTTTTDPCIARTCQEPLADCNNNRDCASAWACVMANPNCDAACVAECSATLRDRFFFDTLYNCSVACDGGADTTKAPRSTIADKTTREATRQTEPNTPTQATRPCFERECDTKECRSMPECERAMTCVLESKQTVLASLSRIP